MIEYYSVIMDQMRKEGNHMKKLVGIIALLLALVFILTACGKEEKTSSDILKRFHNLCLD